jgi:hypothetical protein
MSENKVYTTEEKMFIYGKLKFLEENCDDFESGVEVTYKMIDEGVAVVETPLSWKETEELIEDYKNVFIENGAI